MLIFELFSQYKISVFKVFACHLELKQLTINNSPHYLISQLLSETRQSAKKTLWVSLQIITDYTREFLSIRQYHGSAMLSSFDYIREAELEEAEVVCCSSLNWMIKVKFEK